MKTGVICRTKLSMSVHVGNIQQIFSPSTAGSFSMYSSNEQLKALCIVQSNRWEICLRMRYILRGLREKDLGRVNTVI